ncbi:hypothetical protein A1O3_05040 [Capronia epimyces CBS 606.96]|uniref:Cell wall mannoprotein PIR1-like C-terminal domain-containing protein n=1 Tax=Capronia epimyces CBS 606.96 TaxID=1182542 RepID=W9XVY9_9EURO|nr:uncharacterized protein A1O3_05040 [Capronia epimyces CBS 606.96]EXJ84373.1 hypothetical protein A1O3_05040 [Capronia epimyces CBS 606.96]
MGEISQIGDGQVQGGMHTVTMTMATRTMMPVSQISDGQIQNAVVTKMPALAPASGAPSIQSEPSASPSNDGGSSGPPFAIPTSKPPTVLEQACGIETRVSMALPSSSSSSSSSSSTPSLNEATTASQDTAPAPTSTPTSSTGSSSSTNTDTNSSTTTTTTTRLSFVSCLTNSTLRLSLADGTLVDAHNRTGYIASNYQFQFDGPPQSGALSTTGWSICPSSDGTSTLALGGTTTFWQCLSGGFYNLYTEDWAAQCSPIELRVVALVQC